MMGTIESKFNVFNSDEINVKDTSRRLSCLIRCYKLKAHRRLSVDSWKQRASKAITVKSPQLLPMREERNGSNAREPVAY